MYAFEKVLSVLLIGLFSIPITLFGQMDEQPGTIHFYAGSSVYGGTDENLPFWFHSNVDGVVDPSGTNWLNEIGYRAYLYENGDFSISSGTNLVARLSPQNSLHFSELYMDASLGGFRLSAGKISQPIGLNNHELSVGSMMVSRNATPIPGISLTTPNFLDVPFGNGVVEYKALFSHGWFNENRYVDGVKLHQKYLYIRLNFGRLLATGGFIHNAMWGGTHPTQGRFPQSFSDYLRVITGRSAAEGGPGGEVANVLGNSVAAYDFGLTYEFESFTASLTRLFYLEDKVSTRFRSPWDGVWGLNLYFDEPGSPVQALTYEHINTKQQDARSFEAPGRRDYYNHFLFENGWSYHQRSIGLPLMLYDSEVGAFTNNMIVGHHLGLKGMITESLGYKTFFTYSRNYGRNGETLPIDEYRLAPLRTDQYSFYLSFSHSLPGVENINVGLAATGDFGELHEDRIGLMVKVRWGKTFEF